MRTARRLYQGQPTAATPTDAITASIDTEVARLVVSNTGAATTFRVFHRRGVAAGVTNALYYDVAIAANTSLELLVAQGDGSGVVLAAGDILTVESASGAVTFTLYGSTVFTGADR